MPRKPKGNSETTLTERELAAMTRVSSASDGRGRPLDQLVAAWAAHEPKVRRVWLRGGTAAADPLPLALELQPVADSEETAATWLAHAAAWRVALQKATGRAVELEWLDPDEPHKRNQSRPDALVYERGS
jgi:hypothetical protein